MDIILKAESHVAADNYLIIEFNDKKYNLKEFFNMHIKEDDNFYIDSIIKYCIFEYKGRQITYDELCSEISEFAYYLEILMNYNKLYAIEFQIFMVDTDYYAALKMLESVEKNLMQARYNLIKSFGIIDYNINISWNSGYAGIYNIRAIQANNALMWYSSIYDTMLQMVFFAFGLYKKHPNYSEELEFHKLLKLCDNSFMGKLYSENKSDTEFTMLWNILTKAYNATSKIREWTNYIKHKGGIYYIGASADKPYSFSIDKEKKIHDRDFEHIKLDLDMVISEMKDSHIKLVAAINEIVEFINFEGAIILNKNGTSTIPNEDNYKRLIL